MHLQLRGGAETVAEKVQAGSNQPIWASDVMADSEEVVVDFEVAVAGANGVSGAIP